MDKVLELLLKTIEPLKELRRLIKIREAHAHANEAMSCWPKER